ncbi:PREDICTED: protein sidekick-2 [Bison bison bison]|uniref:Protein sidekick-2 n=1 Tax=Bison bison bison TaxID=43346 RepID=A0A6P3IUD7_BISBB|nr:PREDICTED: protein sidekick-2 [Bison bison bison]
MTSVERRFCRPFSILPSPLRTWLAGLSGAVAQVVYCTIPELRSLYPNMSPDMRGLSSSGKGGVAASQGLGAGSLGLSQEALLGSLGTREAVLIWGSCGGLVLGWAESGQRAREEQSKGCTQAHSPGSGTSSGPTANLVRNQKQRVRMDGDPKEERPRVLERRGGSQHDVPPYFKTEPARTQVHLEGNRLVLTCMAEGSWPLEFKWLHNGRELTRFSLEYRYMITSLDRTHAGFYRCIVRNRMGALLQRQTEVQVAYMGKMTRKSRILGELRPPARPGVDTEQRHLASLRPLDMLCIWSPALAKAITLENTLVILSTVAPDAGRYYVQAVNDKNGDNKTSQPITLAVENVSGPADPIAPAIIIPPKNTSVVAGSSEVTMECVANARPLIKLHIIWKKDGVLLSSGISDYNRRLTIPNPGASDAGYYECEAVLRSSSIPSVVRGAYLSVLEPPQFVKEPERHITAEMEKVVDIPCRAKGVPPPSITWYKDAALVEMGRLSRFRQRGDGGLQISGLVPDDTGMLQCFARNAAGEAQTSTYLAVTSIAPNITRGPLDSTVIDGMSVVLACETSGAPRPAITWQKGERILASGSVQLPRFTLLESGSLLVSPTHISDAGTYTCLATNSRGADEASADLVVWARTRITRPPQDQSVIKGTQASMVCGVTHDPRVTVRYSCGQSPLEARGEGQLSGVAGCWLSVPAREVSAARGGQGTATYRLTAGLRLGDPRDKRDPNLPHAPEHPVATLSTSERRAINLTWGKPFDGNSPLIRYVLEMSENNAPWTVLLASVDPEATSVMVKGLVPARSYQFRLCAVNDVGKGQFSKDTERVSLPEEPPTAPPQNVIASGRTNQSIMIQWQPPPENHQNGILKGYVIRYCLAGLPVGYQYKNITDADVNNLLLEDLIIWTNYEIEVAAYNSAGLGVYSSKVTEWTLQGVPTVPPGNVHAEATNSTTIRFTWNAPSPQFINGINQGYKLIAWEPEQEEEVTMVTARPNFQDSIHVGFVSGLKKFTEYFTSVLCFTTPGDGPRSTPQLVRTHEDVPGPVGHLSFSDVLDTSLKVSWQEPGERNGILTGYRISWEEYNRTNTRVTHYLPNVTLEYRVTGLTALTTYTIEVAAMTAKGQGQVSASTISSGVPPELPGAPTNLGISNIGPRSVTLQFKPGYDGKTSISRWLVEAQVGMVGEGEEWQLIHQLPNEPDARSMEVPDLNPFTYYSFRMRQVNIVGTSPPSQPSRKIQTLQAPPDMAPANVTLRTASETSLWLRWMPLPEMAYNGNPESVGYKIKYSRADGHGKTLSHVVHDRVERECTIEDLEEWTEYRAQVQAFNAVGSGPWSPAVMGRTRESVPSSGPTNVSALATTSSSMLVRWNEVPEADRNGLVLGYKVLYKEKDSDAPPRFWLVEGNSSRSAQLTGLGKYVLYEIQVLAFTRIGDGGPSHPPILERTLDDVPGPPVGILFPEVRTTSVRLVWQPPAAPNGIILAYQITHRLNATSANAAAVEVLAPSARQFTATSLKPESVYLFRITAQTRKGWGEAAEALVVTTEKRGKNQKDSGSQLGTPPTGATGQSLEAFGLSHMERKASWHLGVGTREGTTHGRRTRRVLWRELGPSHTPLKPFTSYKFRVKATNDIGDSEFSEESEPLTTLQAAPDEAPTIVSVTPHTTTSVLIRWQPPSEDKINGILLGFRIRYRELLYDGLRGFTLRGINNPGAKWAELTSFYSMRNLSRPSLTQYELDNLNKHRRYEIRMSVYNAVGEGPSSPPHEVFVGEAVPTAAPRNVAVHGPTATQLDVTWEPPPLESQNGDIQGYKIYFWEAQRRNLTERVKTLFLAENSVKLKNLTGYTAYMVSVAAFNAAGDGPRSTPTRGQTQQAAPSAPSSVRFSELTTTSVNVSWGAPEFPNGVLEGYRLVYEPCTPVDASHTRQPSTFALGCWQDAGAPGQPAAHTLLPGTVPSRRQWRKHLLCPGSQEAGLQAHGDQQAGALGALGASTAGPPDRKGLRTLCGHSREPIPGAGLGPSSLLVVAGAPDPPAASASSLASPLEGVQLGAFVASPYILSWKAGAVGDLAESAPGPPGVPIIVRYSSAIAIHWSSGDPGKGPITRYVLEARPSDEGLWDILIKDIPKEVTSYTFSMDILKPGVSYDFRVIAVNDYGFGTPSSPSQSVPAQKANPFYEEWWFLVVIALVGLIFILLLVFVLIIRGQSKKYAKKTDAGNSTKTGALGHGEMMSLDESSFPALELNNRRLSVKNSFCRKNGLYTRSPPRPSPGSLHYSDEDVTKYNDLIPAESSSLTEKPSEISDSQGSDSEYEVDASHQKAHSFVNHYIKNKNTEKPSQLFTS